MADAPKKDFGTIRIVPGQQNSHGHSIEQCVWSPPADVLGELPIGFSLSMECRTSASGMRTFTPTPNVFEWLPVASLGGFAVYNRTRHLDADERYSHHASRLFFSKNRRFSESLSRRFTNIADLRIADSAHGGFGKTHILPDDLGLGPSHAGEPWNIAELLKQGGENIPAGMPSYHANKIRCGLLAAARRNPIHAHSLNRLETQSLIRRAIFYSDPNRPTVTKDVVERVQVRFWNLMHSQADLTSKDFFRWFYEENDNLIHSIAKQKKQDGEIDRELVRQSLVEIGFQSLQYLALTVHVQMIALANALPTPLTPDERFSFETFYHPQPYLGDHSLILLHNQMPFLREAILAILDAPNDPRPIGALLRMLHYYAEMSASRRDADRRRKRESNRTIGCDVTTLGFSPAPEADAEADAEENVRREQVVAFVNELRRDKQIRCACPGDGDWKIDRDTDADHNSIVLYLSCPNCGGQCSLSIPKDEFARKAKGFGLGGE